MEVAELVPPVGPAQRPGALSGLLRRLAHPEVLTLGRTLDRWLPEVIAYSQTGTTNAATEGCNRKVNMSNGSPAASGTTTSGFDFLLGGDGDDIVGGGNNPDFVAGDAGNDILNGGQGDDYLIGDWGDDRLAGGLGDDFLIGGDDFDDCDPLVSPGSNLYDTCEAGAGAAPPPPP